MTGRAEFSGEIDKTESHGPTGGDRPDTGGSVQAEKDTSRHASVCAICQRRLTQDPRIEPKRRVRRAVKLAGLSGLSLYKLRRVVKLRMETVAITALALVDAGEIHRDPTTGRFFAEPPAAAPDGLDDVAPDSRTT